MISSATEFACIMKQAREPTGYGIEPFTPTKIFGQPRNPEKMIPQAAFSLAFAAVFEFFFSDTRFERGFHRFDLIASAAARKRNGFLASSVYHDHTLGYLLIIM